MTFPYQRVSTIYRFHMKPQAENGSPCAESEAGRCIYMAFSQSDSTFWFWSPICCESVSVTSIFLVVVTNFCYLPTDMLPATVQKIVTEILPPANGVAFSKEARDLLIECCVEFITLVSSEANEISEKEAKKTIACDHITKALEQLGFSDYVAAVLEAASEHKEQQKVSAHSSDVGEEPLSEQIADKYPKGP